MIDAADLRRWIPQTHRNARSENRRHGVILDANNKLAGVKVEFYWLTDRRLHFRRNIVHLNHATGLLADGFNNRQGGSFADQVFDLG